MSKETSISFTDIILSKHFAVALGTRAARSRIKAYAAPRFPKRLNNSVNILIRSLLIAALYYISTTVSKENTFLSSLCLCIIHLFDVFLNTIESGTDVSNTDDVDGWSIYFEFQPTTIAIEVFKFDCYELALLQIVYMFRLAHFMIIPSSFFGILRILHFLSYSWQELLIGYPYSFFFSRAQELLCILPFVFALGVHWIVKLLLGFGTEMQSEPISLMRMSLRDHFKDALYKLALASLVSAKKTGFRNDLGVVRVPVGTYVDTSPFNKNFKEEKVDKRIHAHNFLLRKLWRLAVRGIVDFVVWVRYGRRNTNESSQEISAEQESLTDYQRFLLGMKVRDTHSEYAPSDAEDDISTISSEDGQVAHFSPNNLEEVCLERRRNEPFSIQCCVVCQFEKRCIILRPCGCLALCDSCRQVMASRNFTSCPCCRQDVVGYNRMFEP